MPRYQVDCRPGTRMMLSNGDLVTTDHRAQITATPEQAAFIARLFAIEQIDAPIAQPSKAKATKGKAST